MSFEVKAVEALQGNRTLYVSSMSFGEVDEHLPVRLEKDYDVVTETNRAINRRHIARLVDYMARRADWYLPAITLSACEKDVRYADGLLSVNGAVDILDGQHRRLAIREHLRALSDSGDDGGLDSFGKTALPFCLVVEDDLSARRQMFADGAMARPIDTLTRLEFDSRDPFNNVALQVVRDSEMLAGRVHPTKGAGVRLADEYLVSKTDVKTAVTILELGLGKNPSQALRDHYRTDEREREMVERALRFFDEFLPESRDLFRRIMDGGLDRLVIPNERYDNWELEPVFINLFAGVFSQWVKGGDDDWQSLALYLNTLDMTRHDRRNLAPVFVQAMVDVDGSAWKPVPIRRPAWRSVADAICRSARGGGEETERVR